MPFNYLGTMRSVQWQAFRNFSLNERRTISARLRVIDAELRRIGRITVAYETRTEIVQTPDGAQQRFENVSEKRTGFIVSQGSTLEKLIQSYIAVGGNPLSISMWLQPDEVQFTSVDDPTESLGNERNELFADNNVPSTPPSQPYYGMIAPKSTDSYGPGGRYPGGLPTFIRDPQTIAGRYFDEGDASTKIQTRLDYGRRWMQQNVMEMAQIEHRIMKIVDLCEQLKQERDTLVQQAVGGSVPDFPEPPDRTRYARNLHLTRIVSDMDRTFYQTTADGEPDFSNLLVGTKDNPTGGSLFPTWLGDIDGTDDFATG